MIRGDIYWLKLFLAEHLQLVVVLASCVLVVGLILGALLCWLKGLTPGRLRIRFILKMDSPKYRFRFSHRSTWVYLTINIVLCILLGNCEYVLLGIFLWFYFWYGVWPIYELIYKIYFKRPRNRIDQLLSEMIILDRKKKLLWRLFVQFTFYSSFLYGWWAFAFVVGFWFSNWCWNLAPVYVLIVVSVGKISPAIGAICYFFDGLLVLIIALVILHYRGRPLSRDSLLYVLVIMRIDYLLRGLRPYLKMVRDDLHFFLDSRLEWLIDFFKWLYWDLCVFSENRDWLGLLEGLRGTLSFLDGYRGSVWGYWRYLALAILYAPSHVAARLEGMRRHAWGINYGFFDFLCFSPHYFARLFRASRLSLLLNLVVAFCFFSACMNFSAIGIGGWIISAFLIVNVLLPRGDLKSLRSESDRYDDWYDDWR